MSESDDDASVELTNEEKFKKLTKYGILKYQALVKQALDRSGKTFIFDNPHSRKAYAAHRTTPGDLLVNIRSAQSARIGRQLLTMQSGRGHLVTAGGNKDRPKGIKEPPGEYEELFNKIRTLGKDKNAKTLLEQAGDTSKIEGGKLSDRQVAAIVLHSMNTPIDESLPRSQLTEHLGKLLGIFTAETSRAFEAKPDPYDVSLLIKVGLRSVIDQELTLHRLFYGGVGGSESAFLGAPSEKRSPSRIGGAAQLRNPLAYEEAFARQMNLLPSNKREFKALINRLKTGSVAKLAPQTEKDAQQAREMEKASQTEKAEQLLKKAGALVVPDVNDLLVFLNSGELKKIRKAVGSLKKEAKGNEDALAKLGKALKVLDEKEGQARKKVGLNP